MNGTLIFFFFFISSTVASNITLEANPQRINVLSTETFSLNCTYEMRQNITLLSLRLLKVVGNGTNSVKELVSMVNNSKLHILSPSPDVKYSGRIISKSKAVLFGRWLVFSQGLGGIYKCAAAAIDNVGYIEHMKRQIRIVEEKNEFRHAVAAITKLKKYKQKLATIHSELSRLMNISQRLTRYLTPTTEIATLRYGSHSYTAYYGPLRLEQHIAMGICRYQGGYLAEVDGYNEWQFLKRLIQKNKFVRGFYIAGRRFGNTVCFFITRTRCRVPKSRPWGKRQPDNAIRREHCLELYRYFKWKMNSIKCDERRGFICEKELSV